ncbi:MAG: hypothetical protein HC911_17050, partial [Chloroflexaceae bacterium]|nr:hypothetical protein [Chloroflexaceae bacterium]
MLGPHAQPLLIARPVPTRALADRPPLAPAAPASLRRSRIVPIRIALHIMVAVLLLVTVLAPPLWQALAALPLPMQVVAPAHASPDAAAATVLHPASAPAQLTSLTTSYTSYSIVTFHARDNTILFRPRPTAEVVVAPNGISTRSTYDATGHLARVVLERDGQAVLVREYRTVAAPDRLDYTRPADLAQSVVVALWHWSDATGHKRERSVRVDVAQAQVQVADTSGPVPLVRHQTWHRASDGQLVTDG